MDRAMSIATTRRFRLCVVLAVVVVSGCKRHSEPVGSDRAPSTPLPLVSHLDRGRDASAPANRCEAQGAHLAADRLWRRSMDPAKDRLLHWVSHYSEKYDGCYVLLDHMISVQNGAAALVSELWEPFEATVLAEYTTDTRTTMQRHFCQVDLSDDPFTSCLVAKYFVDEHLTH